MRVRVLIAASAVILMGCSADPEAPSEPSKADKACADITELTPGSLEIGWSTAVFADPTATPKEVSDALAEQAAAASATEPYTCSGPTFDRYLAEYP